MSIHVRDLWHPTFCFKQKLYPPDAMIRCTKAKGHVNTETDRFHSWEEPHRVSPDAARQTDRSAVRGLDPTRP